MQPEPYDIAVLKLGGSLITDKSRRAVVHREILENLASLIASRCRATKEHILIIVGGGSIGHFAAHELRVDLGFLECDRKHLYRMASEMYQLKAEVAELLARHGVAAMPFQETSYLIAGNDGVVALNDLPIRRALGLRMVPVLSGGLIFDDARGVRPLNGDLLPLALNPLVFHVRRVVMLTDVPGVLAEDGSTIVNLNCATRARMARLDRDASHVDITGGMAAKVEVALELAHRGVQCVIARGHPLDLMRLEDLFSGQPERATLVGFHPSS